MFEMLGHVAWPKLLLRKEMNEWRMFDDIVGYLSLLLGFPDNWEAQEEREIPNYVIEHAPLIHLFSEEQFWPCDMTEHFKHTTPHLNYTPLQATDDHPTLDNLG